MMEETSNTALLKAIRALNISDNHKTRQTYYEALYDSALLVPVTVEDEPDEITEDTPLDVFVAQPDDGLPMVLAFTDTDAMLRWNPDGVLYATMPAADLFAQLTEGAPVVLMLNIAGKVGGEITFEEMRLLAQGLIPNSPEAIETEELANLLIEVQPLAKPPSPHLVNHYKQSLKQQSIIEAGYLFMLTTPPNAPQVVLGVLFADDTPPEQVETTLRQFASSVPPALIDESESLGFVPLNGELLAYLSEEFTPIYQKKS